jgi:hypothetical protein
MNKEPTPDFTARKRFSINDFDCELPPEARAELTPPPKRPRILARPVKMPVPYGRIVFLLIAAAVLVSAVNVGTVALWRRVEAERARTKALPTAPTPAPPVVAPRAIRVPATGEIWRIHWSQNWSFPVKVLGRLASTAQLPVEGRPGDAYVIGDHLWFYGQPPGIAYPCWVDP